MPVVEDEEGKVIYDPNPAPGSYQMPTPGPPPPGVPGNFGADAAGPGFPGLGKPGVPSPLAPPAGLRGRARFENEVNRRTFTGGLWAEAFNQWVLSLPDDPLDPEYNEVLLWARGEARRKLAEETRLRLEKEEARNRRIRRAGGKDRLAEQEGDFIPAPKRYPEFPPAPPGPPVNDADARYMQRRKEHGFEVPPGVGARPEPTHQGEGPKEERELDQLADEKGQGRKLTDFQKGRAEWAKPRFKGLPITAENLLGNPLGATSGDPDLDAFLSANGIYLNPYQAGRALETNNYVYFGQEYNETFNTSRDVFMYTEDAKSAGVDPKVLPPELIKQYQKALELPETGRVEGDMKKMWDAAVEAAIDYAKTGQKISPKDLFQLWMQQEIDAHKAGGGRGGGGAGAARMETFDYYRAMMQVLGDISGVGGE